MVVLSRQTSVPTFYTANMGGFKQTIPPKLFAAPTKNDREVHTYKLQKPK